MLAFNTSRNRDEDETGRPSTSIIDSRNSSCYKHAVVRVTECADLMMRVLTKPEISADATSSQHSRFPFDDDKTTLHSRRTLASVQEELDATFQGLNA